MARCGVVCVRTNGWNGLTGQENGSQARQLDTRKHGERKTLNLHHMQLIHQGCAIFSARTLSGWFFVFASQHLYETWSAMFFPQVHTFVQLSKKIFRSLFTYSRDLGFMNLKLIFWWPVERLWFLAQKCLKKSLVTYSNSRYFSIPMFFKTG